MFGLYNKFENYFILKLSPKSFNSRERFPFALVGTESGPRSSKAQNTGT